MKLEKAVELLQGDTFDIEEAFYSDLGGDVYAEYTLRVTDADTLLTDLEIDLGIDLESIEDYDTLHDVVEDALCDSFDGVDGVETV